MTFKIGCLMFCCVLLKTACQAQPKKAVASAAVPLAANDKTLLWEISGNGLRAPSYVFGTMHVLCSADASLSPAMKSVIKESSEIYFEIDMDNLQEMMGAMKYLRMNDGKKISDLLSAEDYDKVKNWFDNHQTMLPFSMMNRFKPYFISSLIGEGMMNCEQTNGMEFIIMKESKQYSKQIKGLETIEFQASIFDSIPYEKQAKDLVTYIDSIESYQKVMQQLIELYRTQDLEAMEKLMLHSDPGLEDYMDIMLYERNRRWITVMKEVMSEKPVLFAVGAGHLPGEEGVLQLLRKAGYTVKPIKNETGQ